MMNTTVMTGFMELTPDQQLEFDRMKNIIQAEYAHFGFTAIDTPVLERADVLLAKAGGETEKQIYRFLKGDTDIAMRFDLTVPLARYVADHYGSLVFPFRRSHIAKVYRGERPQKGRFREFYQCDIDVIGEDTLDVTYDAEMPRIIYAIFSQFNIGAFTVRMNNRKVLSGFMQHLGVERLAADILRVIDKIAKVTPEVFVESLQEVGLSDAQVQQVLNFVAIKGDAQHVITTLRQLGATNEDFSTGVDELEKVVNTITSMGVPEAAFVIDLSIVRGLDYYTGTIYETTLNDYPQLGSVCGGGRYDNLASHYTKRKLPGVGISIGLTRLFSQLLELGIVDAKRKTVADAVLLPLTARELPAAYEAADTLRRAGLNVDVLLEDVPVKKKFKYADRIGIRKVVIVGQDEASSRTVTVQDMETGDKVNVSVEDAIGHIRQS